MVRPGFAAAHLCLLRDRDPAPVAEVPEPAGPPVAPAHPAPPVAGGRRPARLHVGGPAAGPDVLDHRRLGRPGRRRHLRQEPRPLLRDLLPGRGQHRRVLELPGRRAARSLARGPAPAGPGPATGRPHPPPGWAGRPPLGSPAIAFYGGGMTGPPRSQPPWGPSQWGDPADDLIEQGRGRPGSYQPEPVEPEPAEGPPPWSSRWSSAWSRLGRAGKLTAKLVVAALAAGLLGGYLGGYQ